MFKVGRWRNEKIKVVFMLHFQATQVPLSKSRLMISLVPVDVGQPTVRLGKALVQDGICTWKNPVYETVKFTRETKTGILQDKFYQFIISTGSSKSNFFGEVFINLADYVEATSPFTLSIPIKSSFAGAILHEDVSDFIISRELQRENEENDYLTAKTPEVSLRGQLSNSGFDDGGLNYSTHQGGYYDTMVSSDIDGRESVSNASTLDSLFKQKEDSKIEVQQKDVPETQKPVPETQIEQTPEVEDIDWSSEDEVVNFIENTKGDFPRAQEQEPPKTLVEQLQREILALQRKADVTDIELQSLRRQVVKETKRGKELSGQVVKLKQEREGWRMESEKLKSQQKVNNGTPYPQEMGIKSKKGHSSNEVEEDLNHAKGVNKALRSQLRKTQDSNSELILVVRDLEEKLDKREKDLANISKKLQDGKKGGEITDKDSRNGLSSDEEVQERTLCINLKETVTLQEQIKNLQNEMETHIREKRQLEEEIEQYGRDYEMAKKDNNDLSSKFNQKQLELIKKERECTNNLRKMEELESQMSRLENVIRKQAEEFSENSATIIDLETEVSSLKSELERQAIEFEDELKVMSNDKIDLEERALRAEENLRRTKLDNASAAQKLQEEFRELSEELASRFNENEELTIKAEAEAGELRDHIVILEEHLQKTTRELELVQHQCATEVEKISCQLREKDIELEQLLHSHKGESAQLSRSHKKLEDKCEALSNENQTLRMEVERLTEENYFFTKQLEEAKTLVDETKTALQEIKRNRDEFESKYCSALTEIKQSEEELKGLRNLTKKVDELAGAQSKLENLQSQHNELKTRLSEIKSDNENLRKQVSRHKENIQKKDTEIAHLEKFKDTSSKEISSLKDKVKQLKAVRPAGVSSENGNKVEEKKLNTVKKAQQAASFGKPLQNGSSKTAAESRKETSIEKKVTDSRTSDLLSEVALLMEKNRSTEDELKELQEKYSEVSLKFAEVEGERQQLVMTIRNLRNGQRK
ncbi:hypothetical protein KSS87_018978 [Heliosperma pusillum]|nr:hypothetical protein KSS87_018978 [Heliosperma pusillum]